MKTVILLLALTVVSSVSCAWLSDGSTDRSANFDSSTSSNVISNDCEATNLLPPQKKICNDRKKNCFSPIASQTLICKRDLSEVRSNVPLGEIWELNGKIDKDNDRIYLTNEDDKAIFVLPDSCLKSDVAELCNLQKGDEVSVVGLFYSSQEKTKKNRRVLGSMLVLDFTVADSLVPNSVE